MKLFIWSVGWGRSVFSVARIYVLAPDLETAKELASKHHDAKDYNLGEPDHVYDNPCVVVEFD